MGGREKVIVVDDHTSFTKPIKRLLELNGHEVMGIAESVDGVVTFLKNNSGNATVAVVDNCMPNDGDGKKAAAIIRQAMPEITIISFAGDLQTWGDINIKRGEGVDALLKAVKDL